MSLNDKLLKAAATSGITPSEHFGVMLYEGDGSSSHSINGGKFGAGAYFNGSNSRIDITRPFPNQQAYSVSFWFFAENNPASSMRVFDSSENDWSGMFQFIHASDGLIFLARIFLTLEVCSTFSGNCFSTYCLPNFSLC